MYEQINLEQIVQKKIYPLKGFSGSDAEGNRIGFTNYYMEKNGRPFFGISGEFHFSRCEASRWEDEIIKMKSGGVNIISTYVIWIHHEEKEGEFDFSGRRDVRRFLELCRKHELYVILRIGPFAHGEVRNGGLPDWLYGKPFEVRSINEGFFYYTRRYYEQIGQQIKGMLFQEGGPIIAAQIDNEYMHSCAPWEMTTGISNEWLPVGKDGDAYMLALREEAKKAGIETVFYTCTGWGGAACPEEMLPLWGGYAYRPWIFYNKEYSVHPATEEYVYQDFHKNGAEVLYDFHPVYEPESKPYSCCEMGGGMMNTYDYRFVLPYKSVDAMANIKIGSGCNFVGYYVYHGGTNPDSKCGVFLNESQVPKLSYDYQAVLGEFGQARESYHRLRILHYFCKYFGEDLCGMQTVLPEGASKISAEDLETIRYAVRCNGESGYLFLNNFQDHVVNKRKEDMNINVRFKGQDVSFEHLSLEKEENCILPFEMNLDGILLKKATVQPVAKLDIKGEKYYIFLRPEGMRAELTFEDGVSLCEEKQHGTSRDGDLSMKEWKAVREDKEIRILCVSREMADKMYIWNNEKVLFTEGTLLMEKDQLRIESVKPEEILYSYPDEHFLNCYEVKTEKRELQPQVTKISDTRYTIAIPEGFMDGVKDVLLDISYIGDIGMAFIDGKMIHDNFANGDVWEIGLREHEEALKEHPITIVITPLKEGAKVSVESAMAARMETVDRETALLENVCLKPVYEMQV